MAHHSASFFHELGPRPQDARHVLWHRPADAVPRELVVWVPPFAEEMNKSRRMAALQARALAGAGCAVLQMDLAGCGDSAGEFADTSWELWVEDVGAALQLARRRFEQEWPGQPAPRPWLWALRAGCLLAAEAARRQPDALPLLFWQPQASGRQVLQQFLRLAMAAALADGGKAVSDRVRASLAAGETVHIAGYALPAALASGLESATLEPTAGARRLQCIEVSSREDATLSPVTRQLLDSWQAAGASVDGQVVPGPSFWSTVEIELAPALIEATTRALAVGAA